MLNAGVCTCVYLAGSYSLKCSITYPLKSGAAALLYYIPIVITESIMVLHCAGFAATLNYVKHYPHYLLQTIVLTMPSRLACMYYHHPLSLHLYYNIIMNFELLGVEKTAILTLNFYEVPTPY